MPCHTIVSQPDEMTQLLLTFKKLKSDNNQTA